MSTISWPPDLPQAFLVGTFQQQRARGFYEFAPEVGEPLRSRRSTAVPEMLAGEMILTAAEKTSLEAFYRSTCSEGVTAFEFQLQDYVWADPPAFSDACDGQHYRVALSFMRLPT